jgi:hypothetical protein
VPDEASPIVALALTTAERQVVVRAVQALVVREGPSPAADAVLEMAVGALNVGELAGALADTDKREPVDA